MYEELVEELRRPHADCNPWALMEQAADAIEELIRAAEVNAKRALKWAFDAEKAEEKLRWIPVTERLPDEDQSILLWCKRENYNQVVCRSMHLTTIAEAIYQGYTPIAWMPLPELPEEET